MTQILPLGEIAEVGAGDSAPQSEELFKGGLIPFVRTSDVGAIHIGSIDTSRDLLTAEGAKGLKLKPSGTVLFPKSGASTFLNHRVILIMPAYVSSHLATIKANNDLALDRYLFYFLQIIDARDLCQDQAYPSLNRDQIAGIKVPLPSLEKQREIVEKLDNALTEIDLLEGNLGLSDVKADELLQSLLRAAFTSGKAIDEPSGPSAEQGIGMRQIKLGEVVDLFNGSTPLKTNRNYWISGDVPWFTVDDLRKQGKYITHTEKFITKLGLKESSISLIPEDAVLLCCTASVGAIAISKIRLTTNQQFNALVVKDPNQLLVEYLYYWFLANMDLLKSLGRATTIDYISMSKLREMIFQLPAMEKQREIVAKLGIAFAEIELLKAQIKTKKDNAVELRQSLLSSSFSQDNAVA